MDLSTSRERDPAIPQSSLKDTLVLKFAREDGGVRAQVYRETLQFIADKLTGGQTYLFTNNQSLLAYINENKIGCVVSTNDIPCETALLLKGQGLAQVLIGLREDLLEISDIIVDPLTLKSEKYLVGPTYFLSSLLNKIPVNVAADMLGLPVSVFKELVNHNEAETELLNIARLYQKLEWDSNFFGVNIGFISCHRLTGNIEKGVKNFIRRERIDLLEYLCNCHDRESVVTSEKSGYSFVDMRLTFERFLTDVKKEDLRPGYEVRKGVPEDIRKIREIATDIYKHSRYYFDENFDRSKVIEFYLNWAEKAIRGQFDNYAYVLYQDWEPIGFCSIKKFGKSSASIGLFGLSQQCSGKGLAKYLLNRSLQKLVQDEGIDYVEVVTQGRNYEAQRLYQRCGFVTKTTELWYHKWFH